MCVCVSFPIFTNWTAVAGKPLRHHHLGLGPMVPWSARGRRSRCGPTVGRPAPTHYGRVGGRRPGIMRRTFKWDVNVKNIYIYILYIIYYIIYIAVSVMCLLPAIYLQSLPVWFFQHCTDLQASATTIAGSPGNGTNCRAPERRLECMKLGQRE